MKVIALSNLLYATFSAGGIDVGRVRRGAVQNQSGCEKVQPAPDAAEDEPGEEQKGAEDKDHAGDVRRRGRSRVRNSGKQ